MSSRIRYAAVEGADEIFSPEFSNYLLGLHAEFTTRAHRLRLDRMKVLKRAVVDNELPSRSGSDESTSAAWTVPEVPEELLKPGIEISGPASITPMFINALNPDRQGTRAGRATRI